MVSDSRRDNEAFDGVADAKAMITDICLPQI